MHFDYFLEDGNLAEQQVTAVEGDQDN